MGLEGLAVELATPRLTPANLAELRDCVVRMDQAIEQRQIQAYLDANSQFHLHLYSACGNPVLLRSIESLWLQIGPFFNRLFTGADLSLRLNDFHEEAFAAIEAGDGKAARQAMEQDLLYFARFLLNLLDLEQGQH
jgi:DNA-binding GntR family transcriptional regulator